MNPVRRLAFGLGLGFLVLAAIQLMLEPGMGFHTFADFWKPALVIPALTSSAWLIADLCHLSNGMLLLVLAVSLRDAEGSAGHLPGNLATVSGGFFVLLAMLDRAATILPAVTDGQLLQAGLLGYMTLRTGVLFSSLFLLGGFIGILAWSLRTALPFWFRLLSAAVALAALLFPTAATPLPLLLAIWAFVLAGVWKGGPPGSDPR